MRVVPLASLLLTIIACSAFPAEPEGFTDPRGVTDLTGRPVHVFADSGNRPTVFVFVRSDCPISNRYAPELRRLAAEFSSRAGLYLVYPDRAETAASIRGQIAEYGLPFEPLRDSAHMLIKLTGARVTPEAAVLDTHRRVCYCGRIDDRYLEFGKARTQATTHDLEDAIDAVLAGRPVAHAKSRAIGCFISDLQ